MNKPTPNLQWYSAESLRLGLSAARCPFANVNLCPRYYDTLSALGKKGSSSLEARENDRLKAMWERSPLTPKTGDQASAIICSNGHPITYYNFCPEIAYDIFG